MSTTYRVYCYTEIANVFTTSMVPPTVCPNNATHSININSVCVYGMGGAAAYLFGDGSSGDGVITTTTTLTQDMYYSNLTIAANTTLRTNGYRVFVAGTTLLNAGSSIGANGNAAVVSAGGGSLPAGTIGGGGFGGVGGNPNGNGSAGGGLATNARIGGLGAAGVAGSGGNGGAAGAGSVVLNTAGGLSVFKTTDLALRGRDMTNLMLMGGTGGGGGGGGSGMSSGAGGGGGGGCVVLSSRIIVVLDGGKISANGGNGGAPQQGSAGGGGGGGGGCVVVISTTDLSDVTIQASGGLGGGTASAGAVGSLFRIQA